MQTTSDPSTKMLTPAHAVRKANLVWLTLTAICVVGVIVVVPLAERSPLSAEAWFIAPLLWLAMAVPAAAMLHGNSFRGEWLEEPLKPEVYLDGAVAIWSVLAVGVWLSLGACLMAGSAMPGVWPGAVMLMLLFLARPSAQAVQR